jgi:hypothetical protein
MNEPIMTTTTTITVDGQGKPVSALTEVTVPKLNKSFSEPALDKYGNPTGGNDYTFLMVLDIFICVNFFT